MRTVLCFLFIVFAASPAAAQPRPASFVDAAAFVPGLIVDMRYAGSNNFVGRPIDGYERPVCLLSRQAASALAQVARDVAAQGLRLKVFDCYRPTRAVAHFLRWSADSRDVRQKAIFYPEVGKSTLFDGYIAVRSGHSRGSTVDLTLADAYGRELEMGTPFDFFSPRSWTANKQIGAEPQKNRARLAAAMRRRGFESYRKEWWHFTLRDEPFPDTYFNFPVR
ncbi:MAG TPA: M15 family metallopeptidase [Xanthobacteraceae bacterium]|nr:M15 family metallopeptidase [Xanthobacteraceae bacterium]